MAQFDTFYTGKDSVPKIPSTERMEASQNRLADFVNQAAKLKYDIYKENEKEYLKNSTIDPEFVLSDSARKATATQIENYNQRWAKILAQRNGNLTTADKQQMLTEKNWILAQNQNDVANMQKWQQMRQVVMANPDKLDAEEFSKWTNDYMKSGEFNYSAPPIKRKSLSLFLQKNPLSNKSWNKEIPESQNGVKGISTVVYSTDEESARKYVKDNILQDDGLLKDVIAEFGEQPEEIKLKYLDTTGDGKIDASEAQQTNPILQWAMDTKWQDAVRETERVWKKTETTTTGALKEGQEELKIGQGTSIKYFPPKAQQATFAGTTYNEYYSVPEWNVQSVPVNGITILKDSGEVFKDVKGVLDLALRGYIADGDKLIFKVNNNYRNGKYGKDEIIAVNRKDVPIFDDFKIMKDGKLMRIGDIDKGATTQSTPKLSLLEWKKQNPNGTAIEYKAYLNAQ